MTEMLDLRIWIARLDSPTRIVVLTVISFILLGAALGWVIYLNQTAVNDAKDVAADTRVIAVDTKKIAAETNAIVKEQLAAKDAQITALEFVLNQQAVPAAVFYAEEYDRLTGKSPKLLFGPQYPPFKPSTPAAAP